MTFTFATVMRGAGLLVVLTVGPVFAASPTFTNPLDITNPYRPFKSGAIKVYTGKKGQLSVVADLYLPQTRTFLLNGVPVACHEIQETEFVGGQLSETSANFSAQADDGTVYYFGELVDGYTNGVLDGTHEGSWLVGGPTLPTDPPETFTNDKPGVFMPANPKTGDIFRVEDLLPVLDETDTIEAANLAVKMPGGMFGNAIQMLETSVLPNEGPGETKWYAPGVGVLKGKTQGETFALVASTLFQ
jgi:hypothetical protein